MPKKHIFLQFNIHHKTGFRLLYDRDRFGSLADYRSKLRQHKKAITSVGSGRPSILSNDQLQSLLDAPPEARSMKLTDQMDRVGISASVRTVQRALRDRKNTGFYRAAKTSAIMPNQAVQRRQYCQIYRLMPLIG